MSNELVFVYNTDSGFASNLMDLGHRIVAPDTYPCNLCFITYSVLGMRGEWRDFLNGLGRKVTFLQRDELAKTYGLHDVPLPAAFVREDGALRSWISAEEMNACQSLEDLKALVLRKLGEM